MHHFRKMLQKLAFRKDFKISVLYVEMADMFPGLRSTELVIWISILGPESTVSTFFICDLMRTFCCYYSCGREKRHA